MRVEHEGWHVEATCGPRRAGVQPDDEERMAAQAETEGGIVRIGTDVRRPGMAAARIQIVQALQLRPQQGLEAAFVGCGRAIEQRCERMQGRVVRVPGLQPGGEVFDRVQERRIVRALAQRGKPADHDRVVRQRSLGAHAGEGRAADEFAESRGMGPFRAGMGRARGRGSGSAADGGARSHRDGFLGDLEGISSPCRPR